PSRGLDAPFALSTQYRLLAPQLQSFAPLDRFANQCLDQHKGTKALCPFVLIFFIHSAARPADQLSSPAAPESSKPLSPPQSATARSIQTSTDRPASRRTTESAYIASAHRPPPIRAPAPAPSASTPGAKPSATRRRSGRRARCGSRSPACVE